MGGLSITLVSLTDNLWGSIQISRRSYDLKENLEALKRLNNISQLGCLTLLQSDIRHTRLDHSVGVCYLARIVAERINEIMRGRHIVTVDPEAAEILGLIHDIGHGPYSHVMEEVLRRNPNIRPLGFKSHEDFTGLYFREDSLESLRNMSNAEDIVDYIETVKKSLKELLGVTLFDKVKECWENELFEYQIISGDIDVDKIDYLLRDSKMLGIPTGEMAKYAIDASQTNEILNSILQNIVIYKCRYTTNEGESWARPAIGFLQEAKDSVTLLLLARYFHYKYIAHDPELRCAEKLFIRAVEYFLGNLNSDMEKKRKILEWFILSNDDLIIEDLKSNNKSKEILQDFLNLEKIRNYKKWKILLRNLTSQVRGKLIEHSRTGVHDIFPILEKEIIGNITKKRKDLKETDLFVDFFIPTKGLFLGLMFKIDSQKSPLILCTQLSPILESLTYCSLLESHITLYSSEELFEIEDIKDLIKESISTTADLRLMKLHRAMPANSYLTIQEMMKYPEIKSLYEKKPSWDYICEYYPESKSQDLYDYKISPSLSEDVNLLKISGLFSELQTISSSEQLTERKYLKKELEPQTMKISELIVERISMKFEVLNKEGDTFHKFDHAVYNAGDEEVEIKPKIYTSKTFSLEELNLKVSKNETEIDPNILIDDERLKRFEIPPILSGEKTDFSYEYVLQKNFPSSEENAYEYYIKFDTKKLEIELNLPYMVKEAKGIVLNEKREISCENSLDAISENGKIVIKWELSDLHYLYIVRINWTPINVA